PMAGATEERRLLAVACKRLILIEAPSSAYHHGMLVVGNRNGGEEETFYVAAVVKLFLSSLRSEALLAFRAYQTTAPANDLCWGLAECVRLTRLTRPSLRHVFFL